MQHLRVEENPILEMTHLEAASVLLVGPTLKKFNDRGMLCRSIQSVWYELCIPKYIIIQESSDAVKSDTAHNITATHAYI